MQLLNSEQQLIYEVSKEQILKFPLGICLEIGCFKGSSTLAIAQAISETAPLTSKLWCVDPFYGCYDESLQLILDNDSLGESSWVQFNRNLKDLKQFTRVFAMKSEEFKAVLSTLRVQYDWKFLSFSHIDGWHDTEALYNDLRLVNMYTSSGGVILCHDANWKGLATIMKEFCKEYSYSYSFELGSEGEAPFCKILVN